MEIIKLDVITDSNRQYRGHSCAKESIIYNGDLYILKKPGNLKAKNLKNVNRSYSNSPICEYIGSHIYEVFNISVHETILAKYNDRIVVLCKDFTERNKGLFEYRGIRDSHVYSMDLSNDSINGHGGKLSAVLELCDKDSKLKQITGVKTRLFEMILIDTLIGNPDRNNENWGLLVDDITSQIIGLAPVYDNGNCLYDKWDVVRMDEALSNSNRMKDISLHTPQSYFTRDNGKHISGFKLLSENIYPIMTLVAKGLFKDNKLYKILEVVNSVDILSDIEREFFRSILTLRYEELDRITRSINLDCDKIIQEYKKKATTKAFDFFTEYKSLCSSTEEALVNLYRASVVKL